MRVYISADMEGVSGAVSSEQLRPDGLEYQAGRERMTAEVNAAISGAESAGATEFVVSDSHGNGQNLLYELLPANVQLVRSWPRPLGMADGIDEGGYRCAFFLGFHASASNPGGGLSHTLSSRAVYRLTLNGREASEALICAWAAGYYNTPVTLISGDDEFISETKEWLPSPQVVLTKWSRGLFSARCRPHPQILTDIREMATAAVRMAGEAPLFTLEAPVVAELWLKSRLSVEYAAYLPQIERTGAHSIKFTADDPSSLIGMLSFLLNYRPSFD